MTAHENIFTKILNFPAGYDIIHAGHARYNLIGFVHYRRFFTADGENILSANAAKDIASRDDPREYRAISFVAEHLMTVWLIKNRLRIKTLPIIFRENV